MVCDWPGADGLLDASAVVAATAKHRPDGRLRQRDGHRNGHLSRPGVSGESRCWEERSHGARSSNYSPKLRARSAWIVTELAPDYPSQYAGIANPPVLGVHRARLPGRHRQPRRRRAARRLLERPARRIRLLRRGPAQPRIQHLPTGRRARPEVHRASRRRPGLLTMRSSSSAARARSPRGLPRHAHGTTPNRPQGIVVTDFRRHLPPAGGNRRSRRYAQLRASGPPGRSRRCCARQGRARWEANVRRSDASPGIRWRCGRRRQRRRRQ